MEKLTWKDVFNSYNIFPQPFGVCLEKAKSAGYNFIAFNGRVYDVSKSLDSGKFVEVCLESDLDMPKQTIINNHTTITDKTQSEIDLRSRIEKIAKELQDSLNGGGR